MFNKTISVTISSNYLFDTIYDSNQKKKRDGFYNVDYYLYDIEF